MTKSRESILKRIKLNKPATSPLPTIPQFDVPDGDLLSIFSDTLTTVGGKALVNLPVSDIRNYVKDQFPDASQCWSSLPEYLDSTVEIGDDPHELELLDVALVEGAFGVAENAAIWVEESHLPHRALAFITQHLILLIKKEEIVWNMHQAYERLNGPMPGFGLFISGPSKTADIEQSLVIGAQGPRSLTVIII